MEKLERGEEIDIDLKDPSTEDAALKIQAAFRGQQSRKESKQKKEENEAAAKIQAGFRGHQTRKDLKDKQSKEHVGGEEKHESEDVTKEEEEKESDEAIVDKNLKDEETHEYGDEKYGEAAAKIQAGFRGYKTREGLKSNSEDKTHEEVNREEGQSNEINEEEAAIKIQAGFRGHVARQKVEAMKSSHSVLDGESNVTADQGLSSLTFKIHFSSQGTRKD